MTKQSNTEIVSLGPAMQAKAAQDSEQLRALASQVALMLKDQDGALMEPFFRERQTAYAIRRLQTVSEQRVGSERYRRLGCLVCRQSERPHAGNGFCTTCYSRELLLRKQILSDLMQDKHRR